MMSPCIRFDFLACSASCSSIFKTAGIADIREAELYTPKGELILCREHELMKSIKQGVLTKREQPVPDANFEAQVLVVRSGVMEWSSRQNKLTQSHILKPAVTGIKELVDGGLNHVPLNYIRPHELRPKLGEVCYSNEVPVIDLQGLVGSRHDEIVQAIDRACVDWGLFQVINHGIPNTVMENMQSAVDGFFRLPAVERMIYHSEDVHRPVAYVTSFNQQKEAVLNWKDSLRFRCSPLRNNFGYLPTVCREPAIDYCREMKCLGSNLYGVLSESLGLRADHLENYVQANLATMHVNMHYYPPCPHPNLTLGLSSHSDPNVMTVLLQNDVRGLQIFRNGVWIAVMPVPGSLIVSIGDQVQVITNGGYRSVEHRVVTNSERARTSIATFFGPADKSQVGPLPEFVNDNRPALYKATDYSEYVNNFYNKGLAGKSSLDFACLAPRDMKTNDRASQPAAEKGI